MRSYYSTWNSKSDGRVHLFYGHSALRQINIFKFAIFSRTDLDRDYVAQDNFAKALGLYFWRPHDVSIEVDTNRLHLVVPCDPMETSHQRPTVNNFGLEFEPAAVL